MKRIDFMKAIKTIRHPAKIAIAVVKCDGKFNLITIKWFMRTSIKPPMFAISIGKTRFSHKCLQKYRFFNLVILSQKMKNVAVLCGTKSGYEIDKLENEDTNYKSQLIEWSQKEKIPVEFIVVVVPRTVKLPAIETVVPAAPTVQPDGYRCSCPTCSGR